MELSLIHRHSGDPANQQTLGPYRIETLLQRNEEGAGTVYRVHIEPRQHTSVSYHQVAEEYYFVLSGKGIALLNGEPQRLQAGDFLRLPPGTTHGFITEEEPLDMLDIHTPGCRPDHDVFFVGSIPDGFREPFTPA